MFNSSILQANEDKKMRSYAIIPPIMLDDLQKRYVFKNENGLLKDMETDYKVSLFDLLATTQFSLHSLKYLFICIT